VYNNWDKSVAKKIDKKDFKIIDKYNPNTKVIDAQVVAAGGWSKYKGQILHLNSDFSELYSLRMLIVLYMMLIQSFKLLFKNTGLRKGFLVLNCL
jgi:hypothetical protein